MVEYTRGDFMTYDLNIQESHEYRWRAKELRLGLLFEIVVFCGGILISFVNMIRYFDSQYFSFLDYTLISMSVTFAFLLLVSPFVFIPLYKMLYLVKHRPEFTECNVKMVNPERAFRTRSVVYYFNLRIEIDGEMIDTSTNAVFPAQDELSGNPFNNKTFKCLYDSKKNKLYVVNRLD